MYTRIIPAALAPTSLHCCTHVTCFTFATLCPSHAAQVLIPTKGETAIADPRTLYAHVQEAWGTVVEENQAGLGETTEGRYDYERGGRKGGKGGKGGGSKAVAAPLSEQEAWHHYQVI